MEANNMAAIREAIGDLLYMAELYVRKTPATESIIFDAKTKKEIRTINYYDVIAKAKAALAAPPRNCDVLSADQFKKIWEHEMRIYMPKEATDRDRNNARIVAYGVIDALFAEQKGENNGK